jgi:transketolase
MRNTALNTIFELANKNKKIIFVGSDLGVGVLDKMNKKIPKQFLMEGISEQNLVGVSAGISMNGLKPYVNTIGTFLTRRCFEQIVIDLGLHDLPVTLIGNGGGGVYGSLGPTHTSLDDFAILRSVPNMTIIAPSDPEEMKNIIYESVNYKHPIYIRFGLGGEKKIFTKKQKFKIGKGIFLKKLEKLNIISTGSITQEAVLIVKYFKKKYNINIGLLHLGTVKPLDKKKVIEFMKKGKKIAIIEEHYENGGFGSLVLETCVKNKIKIDDKIRLFGVPNKFQKCYGKHDIIKKHWGLDANSLISKLKKFYEIKRK